MSGVHGVRAVFDRWHPALVRWLRARVGDADLADDIAQEAFVRLLDHQPRNPGAWLRAVAANLATDHSRTASGRARHLALVADDAGAPHGEPAGADPAEALLRSEEVAEVRAVLARLTARDRSLLLLHHGGFTYAELAGELGVAPSSVGPLLTRAQRRFVRAYESSGRRRGAADA